MSVQSITGLSPAPERAASGPPALWILVAGGSGLAVGAAASVSVTAGVVVGFALALLIWVIPRPPIILIVLFASVFAQVLTVGGVTISRIAAPIALLIVIVALLRGATLGAAPPLLWAAAYGLWAVASGLWSVHLGSTVSQLASLGIGISYMLAFAVLLAKKRDLDRVLYALAIVALGIGVYGMVTSHGRAGTDTGDANYFAMIEIIALPLVLVLATEVRDRWLRVSVYGIVLVIIAAVFSS